MKIYVKTLAVAMHARSYPGTINFPTQTAFNRSLRLGRAQNFSHPHRRLQSKNFVTKILTLPTLVLLFKLRIFSSPLLLTEKGTWN